MWQINMGEASETIAPICHWQISIEASETWSPSATPKLRDWQPVAIGRFPCELPLAVLTHSIYDVVNSKPYGLSPNKYTYQPIGVFIW